MNTRKHNLRIEQNTYIAQLRNVPPGATCRHTGFMSVKRGDKTLHIRTRFPQDKDMLVYNCGSYQIPLNDTEHDVIFGCNDLMEVHK